MRIGKQNVFTRFKMLTCQLLDITSARKELKTPGRPLKYDVVSRRDQENTVKGLFFEIKRCARAARLGVQNRRFSTKRVPFSKSLGFVWLDLLV